MFDDAETSRRGAGRFRGAFSTVVSVAMDVEIDERDVIRTALRRLGRERPRGGNRHGRGRRQKRLDRTPVVIVLPSIDCLVLLRRNY